MTIMLSMNPISKPMWQRVLVVTTMGALCAVGISTAGAQSRVAPWFDCGEVLARAATAPRATVLEGFVGGCGHAGEVVINSVIINSTDVVDDGYFTRLRDLVPRSRGTLAATLQLASNPSATPVARLGGLRLLATQLLGAGGDLLSSGGVAKLRTVGTSYCFAGIAIGSGDKTEAADDPLPPDYRSQIQAASERIMRESGADPAVRRAALCLRRAFGPLPPEPVDPATIALTAVCQEKFRVTNRGRRTVILWFDVVGKPGRTMIGVLVGDSFIWAEYPGLLRLYDGDRLLTTAKSSETRCPVTLGKP